MSKRYLVNVEIDEGEWVYATAENPFTYDSKPLIFETEEQAKTYARKFNTSVVVEQSDIRPFDASERARSKVREEIKRGI